MNTFFIISIIVLIVSIIIWICISREQISLEQDKRKKQQLETQIKSLQKDYTSAQNTLSTITDFIDQQRAKILLLKNQIQQKKETHDQLIANINKIQIQVSQYQTKEKEKIKQELEQFKKSSDKAAQAYVDNLENYYNIAEARSKEKIASLKQEQDKAAASLNKIVQTRNQAYQAILKEKQIKAKQDDYRLLPSKTDLEDIYALEHIKQGLHKPRILSMLIWQTYFQPIAKKQFPIILQDKTKMGIYKITNIQTDQAYIGQSTDIYTRWCTHCKAGLGIDTPVGNKLYKAMQEYGLQNFTFELLSECNKQQLDEKERYFIELYQADLFGYNGTKGNK